MNDLISRQAVIDVLEERLRANGYSNVALVSELNRSIGYLMRLPSAQPELVWCKDCEQWYPEEDNEYGRCRHLESYTTGSWYCADGERREHETD